MNLYSDNYYPQTMIQLCVISYDDISTIPGVVAELTDQQVVWGPAELVSDLGVSYSLAYVTLRPATNEYTVVIRGTQMDSWTAWTTEDFKVSPPLQPFNLLDSRAPADALVSQGTYNGVNDLLSLLDPNTGESLMYFLEAVNPPTLYVTGHSLGGTLTPPMYAYLKTYIYGGSGSMAMWSFAGLTSGNQGFADYIDTIMDPSSPWRFQNTLDIAPYCFWSLSDLQDIYSPYGLNWGFPEDDLFERLFKEASGGNYTQPGGDVQLAGMFNKSIFDKYLWTAQAMFQHHSTTYQTLVNNAYPVADKVLT